MKLKIIAIACAATVFASCNKELLNPQPEVFLGDVAAFSDSAKASQQVNGMYAALKAGGFYAGRYLVYQDVRGEDFLNNTNNAVTAWLTWQFNVTPTANEVQTFWVDAYQCINRCNVVLEGIQTSPISATLRRAYTAEAKTLRALSYYSLMQLYARPFNAGGSNPGVPLRLTASKSSGLSLLARSTVAEVYTQILKDLNEAEADAILTYGSNPTLNTTRVHRNTIIALKSRVYLTMGRWSDVITEGNKIVPTTSPWRAATGVANQLNATAASVYASPYTSAESIFSMPFTALNLPGTQNSLASYYLPSTMGGNGDFIVNPLGIMANADWKTTDARRSFITNSGGANRLVKWPNAPGTNPDWAPVIRYAEVMLNLAEALAQAAPGTTVDTRALALLNGVRQRSDATTTFAPATKTDLLNRIYTERQIELLGEGFRSSDIMRLGMAFPAKGTVATIPVSQNVYIWPISQAELLVNTLCTQNTGY